MVDTITSYSRSGLRDWLMQRVTAVIIAAFAVTLLSFMFTHMPLTQTLWQQFFSGLPVKILAFLSALSIVVHAWIGMWTVYTDYVKPAGVRLLLQILTILALMALLVWSAAILWG